MVDLAEDQWKCFKPEIEDRVWTRAVRTGYLDGCRHSGLQVNPTYTLANSSKGSIERTSGSTSAS
jgi:hypothetical protein